MLNSSIVLQMHLQVEEVRRLCKHCGLDSKGSKMDLALRIRDKMSNRVTYNKVFEKVWGASGKWNNPVFQFFSNSAC